MNKNDLMNYLISMWDIQDSLLQSYRNIFLTSESIFASVAVFVASTSSLHWFFPLLGMGIFIIFWLWIPICTKRGCDVWFFHLNLLYYEVL